PWGSAVSTRPSSPPAKPEPLPLRPLQLRSPSQGPTTGPARPAKLLVCSTRAGSPNDSTEPSHTRNPSQPSRAGGSTSRHTFAARFDPDMWMNVAACDTVDGDTLRWLYRNAYGKDGTVRLTRAVVFHPACPADVIGDALDHPRPEVRAAALVTADLPA